MNTRISRIVEENGLTKSAFGKRLGISQSMASMICNGSAKPSDRTISDICREFGINEHWLRTGEGEMKKTISRDIEIAAFMGAVMRDENDDFVRRLVSVLSKLDVAEWELLEKMAMKLAAEAKKEDQAEA